MTIVRYTKIFLVLCVGVWGLLGTIGNLSDLPNVYTEVGNVVSMSAVPENVGPPWRTVNPVIIWMGVFSIVLGKLVALIAGYGGIAMLRQVNAPASQFSQAKKWAIAGCGLAFGMMFFNFTLVAENAFFMFYDPQLEVASALAFRFAGSFALITIIVAQPDVD